MNKDRVVFADCQNTINNLLEVQQIKQVINPILLRKAVVIDIQGFYINKKFIPKELSLTNDGYTFYTYVFKPPCLFRELSPSERRQVRWLQENHHCLDFNSGNIDLENFEHVLQPFLMYANVIFVKGNNKFDVLKKIFPNVVNLEYEPHCLKFSICNHTCNNHNVRYSFCALENVKELTNFVLNKN